MALILNLSTGHVSPQYHVVYDDTFSTVDSIRTDKVPSNWSTLCSTSRELVMDENFDLLPDWTTLHSSSNSVDWLASFLDSEPTTVQTVFGENEGHFSSSSMVSPNEGDAVNEGECIAVNEGERVAVNEGESVAINERGIDGNGTLMDPFSGNLQDFSETLEPIIRRSGRTHKPTKRLIQDSLFGCPALTHNRFQRFNFSDESTTLNVVCCFKVET